ncbi:hypothetical protein [Microbacterium sp. NPDC058389]|uniref:hypothetical protein n=1 Tax=Microbacterium sp. NPDC058389 TaxID=3346475 RepID=UPI0036571FCF
MREDVLGRFRIHRARVYSWRVLSPSRLLRPARRREAESAARVASTPQAPLRVVVTQRPPSHRVRYVDQLVGDDSAGGAPADIHLEFRDSLRDAPDADVVVLTSVSAVVGDRRVPVGERERRARRFVRALRRRRIALVRSLSGDSAAASNSGSRAEAILDQFAMTSIVMSPAVPTRSARTTTVIPHSHLRSRFLGYPRTDAVAGRLLFLASGTLPGAYEGPLKVFAAAAPDGWSLRVVGQVPQDLASSFARTVNRYPATISLCDEPLSDAALVTEVGAAELVVVASGTQESLAVTMLALSLDRPVLAEDTPSNRLLADEVGHDWVRLHRGPLTSATLEHELVRFREHPAAGRPDLDARDPNAIAAQYADVFRAAASSA